MKCTMVGANCPRLVERPADKKSHKIILSLVFSVLALMISPAMHGQATGSFSGNVLDKSGSAIPGAAVVVTSQGTGLARDTKTDSAGHYLVPLLPVGTFTVSVMRLVFKGLSPRTCVSRSTSPANWIFRWLRPQCHYGCRFPARL